MQDLRYLRIGLADEPDVFTVRKLRDFRCESIVICISEDHGTIIDSDKGKTFRKGVTQSHGPIEANNNL